MGWIKSNVAIVVMLALIVIMLPVAWVGTSMWNASIRKAQEEAANKDYRELEAAKITYEIPAALPGTRIVATVQDFMAEHYLARGR